MFLKFFPCSLVKILLSNGALVDAADSLDRTPLIWAALYGHYDVVQALISAGNKQAIKIIDVP